MSDVGEFAFTPGEKRFAKRQGFIKPNDRRALNLMNAAARAVVTELPDVTVAYGVSDEYRCVAFFALRRLGEEVEETEGDS